MEFPEGFNQLDLLESHGHLIPKGSKSVWEENEDEEDEDESQTEEWYQQHELKLQDTPTELMLWAAERNRLATVERLLASNSTLASCYDSDGYTPLHRAAYGGHFTVVLALLDAGADLHMRTADGWTPLHSACYWGHTSVASCLLRQGAEVNAMTKGQLTPLQLAAGNAKAGQTIELLLSQRTLQIGVKNSAGETAYDIAYRTSPHHRLFEMAESCNNIH
ncbi:ankyrin repeat domain-containing protein 49 [Misgurnus anguillicaudatus]|uniref:ankyrin repeat domain-containing protein 49 n=1 Tax=Misgurnus anguillicaudatus TaxID=75329 RepID=UPI0024353D12|nr:ankyrin repeat domain-containing protein 49 [Misgurnus anguillicaudatus]